MVQLAYAVGLQQGRFGQRQFAALEVFLAQAVPAVGVEAEIARAVGGIDALVEELPRLRHTVLAGAQGGQLDQDLRQEVCGLVRSRRLNGALDPLGRGIQFAQFRIEGRDVYVENCGSAVIVGGFRLAVSFEEGLESRAILVEGELAAADIA